METRLFTACRADLHEDCPVELGGRFLCSCPCHDDRPPVATEERDMVGRALAGQERSSWAA